MHLRLGQDFVLDGDALHVIYDPPKSSHKNIPHHDNSEDGILAPSLLVRDRGHIMRREVITTSDFLIPSTLHHSNNDKIYGFYYLVS